MYRYLPPGFELFEFDDEPLGLGRPGHRRFTDWNGRANEPAEEVSLAWRGGEAAALVATSGRSYDQEWLRVSAALVA